MHLLRKCPCPALLIRPNCGKPCRRIVAAVDVDDAYLPEGLQARHLLNIEMLEFASFMALSENAELHRVDVWRAVGESMIQGWFMRSSYEEMVKYVEEMSEAGKNGSFIRRNWPEVRGGCHRIHHADKAFTKRLAAQGNTILC